MNNIIARSLLQRTAAQKTLFVVPPGIIHLGVGAPSDTLLSQSCGLFQKATDKFFSIADVDALQYGPAQGHSDFRDSLAEYISSQYEHPTKSDELIVTNGSSSGLALLLSLFAKTGGSVFVEDPTYFIAVKVFQDFGLNLISVPTDNQGMCVDQLESLAETIPEDAGRGRFKALVYLVPTYSNPKSCTLLLERRKRLVEVAKKQNLLVVCDDVYDLLHFDDGKAIPRVLSYDDGDNGGCVVSNCSFSKIFGPGVRLGWIEARKGLVDRMAESGFILSGGSMNQLTSCIFTHMIRDGHLNANIEALRVVYQQRCAALCDELQQTMPYVTFETPQGGYFVWVKLPEDISANELAAVCEDVRFMPGPIYSVSKGYQNHLRLSFAFYEEKELREGVKRMAKAFQMLRERKIKESI